MQGQKCACVLIAGGMGSRLRFNGPKGTFPISPIRKKSLFQLFFEKVKAAEKWIEKPLDIAVMTSASTEKETVLFLQRNNFFNLNQENVWLFSQKQWPLLDLEGNLFFEAPGKLAAGPNGNGDVFSALLESGILKVWQEKDIRYVNFVLIDNALADPFDAELFGFHDRMNNQVTPKVIERKHADEKVGVFVKFQNKSHIVEYTELSNEDRNAKVNGKWKFTIANLSLFCFSLSFLQEIGTKNLKIHVLQKAARKMKSNGEIDFPFQKNCYKFELYIFDCLSYAQRVKALLYPREECFAPLKNLEGEDSIKNVQEALVASDRRVFQCVSGKELPHHCHIELSQEFYYPTATLIEQWKGKVPALDQRYIEGAC